MSTNCKFYKEEEYVSYDSGETWTAMGVYRKGDLIEYDSEDCGYVPPTPTGNTKFSASYSDGTSYSAECDSDTTLTTATTTPRWHQRSRMTTAVIGDCINSIGERAFENCYSLTSVTIPNSVQTIENYAFRCCSGLTSIDIPNSVTSIGTAAFASCSGLTSVTIPDSVTSIGWSAFEYCSGITSLTIGSGITSIEHYAFFYCTSLTSIVIPNSVTSIGESVFSQCSGLTSVTIPDNVTSISGGAFNGCSSLPSIDIPSSVTSIGSAAFQLCSALTSVTIPDNVTSIGYNTFSRCSSLTSIDIPSSVTSIGGWAFRGCTSLTSVTIPNSVTSIGEHVFSSCTSLTSVTVEAITPPTLGNNVFDNTNNCPIYVPCESVNAYKTATNWSTYASRITCTTLPYDAEIEYLESTGTQYINTGVYLNTSNFEIGCSVADTYCLWGYCHQNVANGTWLSIECTSSQKTAFFGRFGSNYMVNMTSYIQSSGNTFVYKQNGITVNGTTTSKSLSIGSDSIANVPLIFFGRYDFYKRGVEWIDNNKFKSFYVKNNNELVLDMIPVRVGTVGYMYDRVSGQLFGNSGSGSFVLGADKT